MVKENLKNTVLKGLLMASAVMVAVPHVGFAANDLNSSVTNLTGTELTSVPDLIAAVFYIGGAAFMGSGAIKLKQYSENPANAPLGQGLGRCGVGAFLLALPLLAESVIATFAFGGAAAKYTAYNKVM